MKMMNYNVAVGLLVIAVSSDMVLSCPSTCYCTTDINGVTVNCDNRGLTVIPRNFTNDSYYINMNNNPITTIEEGTFQKMTLLYRVLLQSCNIATIETGAFMTLPNLQILDLDNNQITTIQQGAFKDLPVLEYIGLYNNQITAIQRGMFDNLQALAYLNLRGNNLTFVKNDTFEHNINLQFLYLNLVCDCNFPFWSWLKSKSWFNDQVTCVDRENIKLSSLQESDFDNCTYDSCYPDYCLNGGSCSQNSYGNLVCSCVGGWTGTTCTGKWNTNSKERL